MTLEPTITPINPDTFEYQTYSNSDENLIIQSELDTVFSSSTDYIEYYIYDQNKDLIYPNQTVPLLDYNVREGDVLLNPSSNLESLGFDIGEYNISYSFYRKRAASSIDEKYFISNISSDRTEIRLDSNTIENNDIISSVNDFIQYREASNYFVDFYLNLGQNQTVIANNIKLETEEGIDPTILIKLYEPLPLEFSNKSELWVVELLSTPQAYKVDFPFEPFVEEDFTYIAGPNYNLNIIGETASPGEQFSYNTLINSDLTSSINQIQSLLNEKEINININYEKFSNFVNFSSAKTRLENFYYKVDLIQSASNQITTFLDQVATDTVLTTAYSSSVASLTGTIDTIIKNFDGYEYFLYFNSGSSTSYPKSNTQPPFTLYSTGSTEVQNWITSSAATASDYDDNNRDWLYNSIPEYLRDDPANRNYELFVDMVGQYYDNVWVYTKDVTNKFDADNRLDYGISKDLVSDAIKDFAIKLYSNNFNTDDLFTAFLGLTPSGSAFPFPYMTGSIGGAVATPTGYEYVDTQISASNDIVPLDDVNKRVYKRIYHNIPYLLKTKGTIAGLRALITSYGIPDTILRISEFGGKDRNESQDYDLKQDVFNYAFDTGVKAGNYLSSSLQANTKFPVQNGDNKARTIQLRFKPSEIPLPANNVANSNIRYSQSIWSTDDGGNLVLEYTGSGFVTGSYSGSIASPYDTYGTLKWVPAQGGDPAFSASVYLPFFNGDWWSVQMNVNGSSPTASLYAANEIDGKIGFNESSSIVGFDDSFYYQATKGFLNKNTNVVFGDGTTYSPFSGSFQELRYYVNEISQSNFYDYTVNPYSNEGNGINSTPDQQFFRAALGTQLDTGSRTSIHPRVTGSAVQITQSFASAADGSNFYINAPNFITNVEDIFQDQAPVGIKNRITDKIQTEKITLAEAPYGFPNPTASVPDISSRNNFTQTISPMESMQQTSFTSQSITPNINYLEVAFSPSNQINDDINAQLGYFNLGDFIGDPRFVSSSLYTYPDLDRLRNAYFEKYMDSYDVVDFIRLIKFFDNSLFKMIKDFTPARTSLSSGVVVKQHILERNRQRPAQATSSLHDYEGLVVNLPKDYSSGSTDFPQYSTEGSSIYKFSGGTGGSFERFNGLQTYGIPKYGRLLGRVTLGAIFTGTSINNKIILNTLITDTGTLFNSGDLSNISATITRADGFYPQTEKKDFILTNIGVDCRFISSKPTKLSVFSNTANSIFLSAGNQVTIIGSSLDPNLTGKLVVELIDSQITPSSNWNATIPYNRFGVTQSWQDGNDGSVLNTTNFNQSSSQYISGSYLGPRKFPKDNQSEFYDGIFSGSMIVVATQSLNPGCDPYLNANDTPVVYNPLFFGLSTSTNSGLEAVVAEGDFNDQFNVPPPGYAWISSARTNNFGINGIQQVQTIKLSDVDTSGTEVINYLDDFDNLRILFTLPSGKLPFGATATEYIITGRTIYADHIILQVSQTEGNNIYQSITEGAADVNYYPITSSTDGGSMNWSLRTKTDFLTSFGNSESIDNVQQNVFLNPTVPTQEQNIYFYNNFNPGITDDALGFFDPGTSTFPTSRILSQGVPRKGAYTIPYTPNIPWSISASFKYSASLNLNVGGITTQEGIYHQGITSQTPFNIVNQNFVLSLEETRGFYVDAESAGYNSATLAGNAPDLTSTNNIIYYTGFDDFYGSLSRLYDNEDLSIVTSLTVGKYYKFSNLDSIGGTQTYFIVLIENDTGGTKKGTLQITPRSPATPPKTATRSDLLFPKSFAPAPFSVSNLGQVLFNGENFNPLLPGNSGSGTDMNIFGGHPKLKVDDTTSEIYWNFDELTLAGTPPTIGGGSTSFVPFSGSDAYLNNTDFDLDAGDIAGYGSSDGLGFLNYVGGYPTIPRYGETYDGSVQVQWSGPNSVATYIHEGAFAQDGFGSYVGVDVWASFEVDAGNGADFTVQFCAELWDPAFPPINPTVQVLFTANSNTSTGVAALTGEGPERLSTPADGTPRNPASGDNPVYSRFFFLVRNNGSTILEYEFKVDNIECKIIYNTLSGGTGGGPYIRTIPASGVKYDIFNGGYSNDKFQNGSTNKILVSAVTGYYNECVVNAYLKRTGSQGDFIITSSIWPNGGYSGSIYSGSVINFDGSDGSIASSPIIAFDSSPFNNPNNTGSTISKVGDMYYTEYEFRDFKGGVLGGVSQTSQNIAFQLDNDHPLMQITASGDGGSNPNFGIANSSVRLRRSNLSDFNNGQPNTTGLEVLDLPWDTTGLTQTSIGAATVTGIYNGNFSANDIHRLSMQVNKTGFLGSGLVITEFSASIFPGASVWSPTSDPRAYNNYRVPNPVDFLVPTYYAGVLPFNLALDCQPLLNNFILQRPSGYIMDVDYNNQSGSLFPVNQEQILKNTAVKAAVPDSNYTSLRSINPRYNGVKSTSAKLNVWSVGDFGTYGKTPTVELRDAYFGYFNDLDDPYPNINGLTRVNLSYLVDEQGNALPPSIEPITIDTFNAVFPNTTLGKIAVRDINSKYQDLGSPSLINRTMEYVTPICYSQNSGENYANIIPLSGSGYISRYDNDDDFQIDFAKFTAVGSTTANTTDNFIKSVNYVLNPQNANANPVGGGNTLPYDPSTGITYYPAGNAGGQWGTAGDDLNNEQILSIQTSVVTSHVSETATIQDELKLHFQMLYSTDGSTNFESTPFNLEYIDCKVYTDTGQVYLIKNVDEYGWFKYTNISNTQNLGPRYNSNLDRWTTSRVNVPSDGIKFSVAYEMSRDLFAFGLMREWEPKNTGGVVALEWIISANSGKKSIKSDGGIKWNMAGSMTDVRSGWQQGFFFPPSYAGEYTPTKIQGAGTQDHLLAEANQAEAPFWVTATSANDSTFTSTDPTILIMTSSNFNEAYGTGYYQGDLPYIPGISQYFPGNVEPKTTAFDPIENPLEFQENDEIRFGNNENFTYRILEVFAPQENIGTDNKGYLKLKLDKAVDTSINKDFFLVRRKVVNPNSLYLDTPFPYGILSSGSISQVIMNTGSNSFGLSGSVDENGLYTGSISDLELATTPGILFPDFPTEYLTKSASMIVNDLISKGVIES